jgi:hypothetical protein
MKNYTYDKLSSRLETLGMRIAKARDDVANVSKPVGKSTFELQQRHDLLREKLDAASQDHDAWDMLRYEIELDVTSLEQDFDRWIRYLDKR